MFILIQGAFSFDFSIKNISESYDFKKIGIGSSNYYESKDFENGSNCFDGECLYSNIKPIIDLITNSDKVFSFQDKQVIEMSLLKLEEFKKSKVSIDVINEEITPIYKFLFSLDDYSSDQKVYSIYHEITDILHACSSSSYYLDYLKGENPISEKQFFVATQLCKKSIGGVSDFFNLSEGSQCKSLLEDTFDIIDIKGQPGTFASHYVQFILENPDFDKHIIAFNKRLKSSRDFLNKNPGIHEANEKLIPDDIKKLDLGKIAFEITGNLKDAIRLLQLTVSDPGAIMINKLLRVELRKTDSERFAKLSPYINNTKVSKNRKLSFMTVKMFYQSFKRNWSVRNYKMLAGAALALELMEKGYGKEQASWASQFVGEAYKVRRILVADDISGDRPYFLLDSSAHYTGAAIAAEAMSKKSLNEINNDIELARKKGLENAQSSWDYLEVGRKMVSTWMN